MSQDALNALSLLDKSIDDIEDLPGFEVPPQGVYTFKMNCAVKSVNDKAAIEVTYEVMEALELNDSTLDVSGVKPGTKFSTLYFIQQEIAMGKFKELVAPIAAYSGENNVAKLVTEVIKDLIVSATLKHRKNKDDADKPYADVSKITVV